jgi:DNA helicase HerA-like ATPase
MEYLLRRAYQDVQRRAVSDKKDPERWTLNELMIRLRQLGEGESEDAEEGDSRYKETAEAIIWRLESILNQSIIFDDFKHLQLNDLFKPGQCSVLQLNEVEEKQQQVMVATLLRRLFRARMDTQKQKVSAGEELYLPYPVFVLLEEAHHFAPANADVVSAGILKTILGEGRKFGIGVGLISQRPGKLDPDVLSQCNTQFLLRIVNPVDQARVAESVETVGRDLLRELPALTKGQVIIAGQAVNTPILCRVRTRHTTHGAESINAPREWVGYTSEEEEIRRSRDTALPSNLSRRESIEDFLS